jgi:hypothetical protein
MKNYIYLGSNLVEGVLSLGYSRVSYLLILTQSSNSLSVCSQKFAQTQPFICFLSILSCSFCPERGIEENWFLSLVTNLELELWRFWLRNRCAIVKLLLSKFLCLTVAKLKERILNEPYEEWKQFHQSVWEILVVVSTAKQFEFDDATSCLYRVWKVFPAKIGNYI